MASVLCVPTHDGPNASIRHLHKDHGAEKELVLAASSLSAQAKSQRAEAFVEASNITPLPWLEARTRPLQTRGPPRR